MGYVYEKRVQVNRKSIYVLLTILVAVELFVFTPIMQPFSTRIAPWTLIISCEITFLGYFFLSSTSRAYYWDRFRRYFAPAGGIGRWSAGLIGALYLWAAVSLIWIYPSLSGLREISITLAMLFSIIVLSNGIERIDIHLLGKLFTLGLYLGCIFLYFAAENSEFIRFYFDEDFQIFDHNRNVVAMVMVLFVVFCIKPQTLRYKVFIFGAFALTVWTIIVSQSEIAKLALVTGAFAATLVFFAPASRTLVFISLAVVFFIMPVMPGLIEIAVNWLPQGFAEQAHAVHRLEIWKAYSSLIYQKPLFGWGMNSDEFIGLSGILGAEMIKIGLPPDFVSPHNFALEIWVNLGVIGATLFSGIICMGYFMSRNGNIIFQSASTGSAVAVFTVALGGSSFFQGWLLASMVLSMVIYMTFHRHMTNSSK